MDHTISYEQRATVTNLVYRAKLIYNPVLALNILIVMWKPSLPNTYLNCFTLFIVISERVTGCTALKITDCVAVHVNYLARTNTMSKVRTAIDTHPRIHLSEGRLTSEFKRFTFTI